MGECGRRPGRRDLNSPLGRGTAKPGGGGVSPIVGGAPTQHGDEPDKTICLCGYLIL